MVFNLSGECRFRVIYALREGSVQHSLVWLCLDGLGCRAIVYVQHGGGVWRRGDVVEDV